MTRRTPIQAGAVLLAATVIASCADDLPVGPDFELAADVGTLIVVTNTDNDGPGSLREALGIAPSGATIRFTPGLAGQTVFLASEIEVSESVTIEGPDTEPVTISALKVARIFEVEGASEVTLRNLVLTDGHSDQMGGAIFVGNSAGSITLENSTIRDSHADSHGGAIMALGTITVINSTISGNTSGERGGGIASGAEKVHVRNSTISGNSAELSGGGIEIGVGSELELYGSTVAFNEAPVGGGIRLFDAFTFASVASSILAHNDGGNCQHTPASHISISSDLTCNLNELEGSLNDTDPLIGPLADNGGFTKTHLLLPGSPAVDAGREDCAAFENSQFILTHDQRGVPRPQGERCDIGSVEQTATTLTILNNATVDSNSGAATVNGTVQCSGPVDVLVSVTLEQAQKAKKISTTVQASGDVLVSCMGDTEWSIELAPASGAFQNGNATAMAMTDADESSAVTQDLRLGWARKNKK